MFVYPLLLMLLFSNASLASGNMWPKHVVKITPAPKQFSAVITNCLNVVTLLPILSSLRLYFSANFIGKSPNKRDMPPRIHIDTVLATRSASMMMLLLLMIEWSNWVTLYYNYVCIPTRSIFFSASCGNRTRLYRLSLLSVWEGAQFHSTNFLSSQQ